METFLKVYEDLNKNNLHLLKDVYREDIQFIDPAHRISGLDQLIAYFSKMYENVDSISFTFADPTVQKNSGFVRWEMRFRHKRLAGGNPITVEGATFLQFDETGMVHYHRDYFDLGALVYEHVPLLGRCIATIKKRLGQ